METRTKKEQRKPLLILALLLLLSFVCLFVVAGISRNHIEKELIVMRTEGDRVRSDDFAEHLSQLERRNQRITRIIGRDEKIEKWFDELR